jgi:hypothetical protein
VQSCRRTTPAEANRSLEWPSYGTDSGTVTSFGGTFASVGVFMCIPP